MLPVQAKAYSIYNFALAAADAFIAVIYFVLSTTSLLGPGELLGTSLLTTMISLAHLAYIGLVYPFLKRRSVLGASLIGTVLFSLNLIILLLATGGFSSPYYALWLMLVLAVGIYRPSVPIGFMVVSTIYFIGIAFSHDFHPDFFTGTIISLLATYITGGLGFWLWHTQHTKLREGDPLELATQKLSQEQLKSEILIRAIGDGVVVVDPQLRIQLLNPAGEKISGWSETEAKGLDWNLVMKLSHEDDSPLQEDQDPFQAAFAAQKSVIHTDLILATKAGKKLGLSLIVSPLLDSTGKITGGVGVFRDITEQKANERQRSEFISTASHEMRTPVAAIEGYVALALNPKVAQVDAKAQAYLSKAQASAQHLGRLFQDLLSTTKLEDGKLPNHPEVFDLSSLLKVTLDEFRLKAEKKQLSLGLISNSAAGGGKSIQPLYYVDADPERIREVLSNLIENAIKFTSHGEITVTLSGDAHNVTVGVHDQGMGISSDDLPHLFQKFYRIDNSKTRTIGGTGLGLYLCRTMIELYSGRMWAESKPGEGSHFYFSLPRIATLRAQQIRQQKAATAHPIQRQSLLPNVEAASGTTTPVAGTIPVNVK